MCRIAELLRPDKAGGKNELIENIDKVHTTEMGIDRIRRNLGLGDVDAAEWCKSRILDKNADITRQGKNWRIGGSRAVGLYGSGVGGTACT